MSILYLVCRTVMRKKEVKIDLCWRWRVKCLFIKETSLQSHMK